MIINRAPETYPENYSNYPTPQMSNELVYSNNEIKMEITMPN